MMMKRILTVWIGLALTGSAVAMDHGKMGGMDHSQMQGMDHGKMDGMDHGDHLGELIHESSVEGYRLAYHLIDNAAQMAKMEHGGAMDGHDMSQMKSHHLMLYIEAESGRKVADAKVGYLVRGPDGTEQRVMAMGMTGGFGADVDLSAPGRYTVKSKSVTGGVTLRDEFSHELK